MYFGFIKKKKKKKKIKRRPLKNKIYFKKEGGKNDKAEF